MVLTGRDCGEPVAGRRGREDRIVGRQRADVHPNARDIGAAFLVLQVAAVPAGNVVDDPHGEAVPQQRIDEVAADEPGAAGDHCDRFETHAALRRFRRRTLKYRSSCMLFGSLPSWNAEHSSRTASAIVCLGRKPSTLRILSELMWYDR